MHELTELAYKIQATFKIRFDDSGVRFIEDFIEQNRMKIAEEEWNPLINSCGAFLGQCIIENYGGKWVNASNEHLAVAFDENNKIYPFAKVSKQFYNGLEDSIYSMYSVIPVIFKIKPITKKKWWQIWR